MDIQAAEATGHDVAEIQGLYGAFSFPEKLLQKIWLRREFATAGARTNDGRVLRIVHPGRWNLLGGPDFRNARLRFDDGPEITGDVEVHLRASDWDAHQHVRDPAYDDVMLHVVLFPPEPGYVTRGSNGRELPVLTLLPLLHHALEEYAADDAVEELANRPTARLTNELTVFTPEQLLMLLRAHARSRWRQKVRFARLRIERLGWVDACHHAALEVLGYRFNRAPMLRVATRWPLAAWAAGVVNLDEVITSEAETWSRQGARPANHPRARLDQYSAWTRARPNWPILLWATTPAIPVLEDGGPTRERRHAARLPDLREMLAREICGAAVGGTRFDNLVCDAFLPLLAAHDEAAGRQGCWYHWFCGDLPPFVTVGLKQLSVCDGRSQPFCHGLAQGLLGWLIERETRA